MVYGRVYSIRSHQTSEIYIGSTTQILCKRMSDHRNDYVQYLNKNRNFVSSFEIMQYNDAYIELLFQGEFESGDFLRKKEGEYIREMDCVNKNIAGRTKQEYRVENREYCLELQKNWYDKNKERHAKTCKNWRDTNKEYIATHNKNKYNENKDKIRNKAKQKFTCECGSICGLGDKSKHIKTQKHQAFILSVEHP